MAKPKRKIMIWIDEVTETPMSWHGVIRHYWPDASDEHCEFVLWECTCYPFDTKTALKQLFDLYKEEQEANQK